MNVYFDCDNTMGLPGCDMDDGMALLYLLGHERIRLRAVTTSFGNSTIAQVHANTERMFRELGLEQIPLRKGAASPQERESEASRFLASALMQETEPATLLITGSPTNIYAACLENERILAHIDEMVFMGGVTEPLIIGGKPMAELNFSSDPEAMHYLINCPVPKTIISAQICLNAFFDASKMAEVLEHQEIPAFAYMREPLQLWYDFISRQYGAPGFHAWDVTAAVYLTNPELFDRRDISVTSSVADLQSGWLRLDQQSHLNRVNVPERILDRDRFWREIFATWKEVRRP
ncbi:inosine-uridine preferring nucleoside hydrolase [Candidatus Vecturithrix granuli]|uniref:Inosine-uridine preferring nucleoside hydrolase n=1 Tax=Vecturithrix granuli TaxID=1499967 RepID=A0A081CAG4_VECG1|nr:inosine-uridine preferring nucleoside hydrolase [Candidatus Vecturithrix granuli]